MWTSNEPPPRPLQFRLREQSRPHSAFTYDRWRKDLDLGLVRTTLEPFPEALAAVIAAFDKIYETSRL